MAFAIGGTYCLQFRQVEFDSFQYMACFMSNKGGVFMTTAVNVSKTDGVIVIASTVIIIALWIIGDLMH